MAYVCGNCKYWKQWGFSKNGECVARGGAQREFDDHPCGSYEVGRYEEPDESSDSSDSGGCFITSMLCHVLGFEDHCDIMDTLRGFRDVKLKQAGCYTELLNEYDVVGPRIAHAIEADPARVQLCEKLLKTYIEPITQMIRREEDQAAVAKYQEMVLSLKAAYSI